MPPGIHAIRETLVTVLIETQLRNEIVLDDGRRYLLQRNPLMLNKRQTLLLDSGVL